MNKQNTCVMCGKDWGDVWETEYTIKGKLVKVCLCANCRSDIQNAAIKGAISNGVDWKELHTKITGG
jgi:hypothetical protein